MEALQKLSQNRYLRFALAGLCFMLFSQGVMRLVYQQSKYDLIRGVGEVLLWGGWAIVNIAHPFGKKIPKVNFAINIGLVFVILSWITQAMQR